MNYLLDTNTVIYFLGGILLPESALDRLDKICEIGQHISNITKLELLGYSFSSHENEILTIEFTDRSIVHPIDLRGNRGYKSL